jgi:hypothetical protein
MHVQAVDALTNEPLWEAQTPGDLQVKIVSEDGSRAVLGPRREAPYYRGRRTTRLVVVGADIGRQVVEVEGNIEPEAFSTDLKGIFILRYTPARRPQSYQVLKLNLATGEIGEVYTPDAELQERMQGTARTQAISPDGHYLYTLYTTEDQDGRSHAFVHVLNLDEEWAHCIDLPDGLGHSVPELMGLVVTPDGDRLYVADAGVGSLAVVDTKALSVLESRSFSTDGSNAPLHALSGPAGELHLARGRQVATLEPGSLHIRYRTTIGGRARGLQASADGAKLYVGLATKIEVIDAVTGASLGLLNPLGVGTIERFGPASPLPVEPEDETEKITCAC